MDYTNNGDYAEPGVGHSSENDENLDRQLAHYSFVREERDREVRLYFRDVPAADIARAFRAAGSTLISMQGERGIQPAKDAPATKGRRRRKGQQTLPIGDITIRYFFAARETVYTVSIVSGSGVLQSVADLYPAATLLEREICERLAVVFLPG